jgi:hypothetical protein
MFRRRVLQYLTAAAAVVHFDRLSVWAQTANFPGAHTTTLRALADVLLPASEGKELLDRQTRRFVQWVNGYRAGAEMEHGYGITRIQNRPAHPAPRYLRELEVLDSAARKQHGKSFAQLATGEKRALVESILAEAKISVLPPYPGGSHVIADFLAFYFRGSEANDLCFEAQIGRDECNGFRDVAQSPRPLKRRGA